MVWFAIEGHVHDRTIARPWYGQKGRASFADMLRTLRQQSVAERVSGYVLLGRDAEKIRRLLEHAMSLAA